MVYFVIENEVFIRGFMFRIVKCFYMIVLFNDYNNFGFKVKVIIGIKRS